MQKARECFTVVLGPTSNQVTLASLGNQLALAAALDLQLQLAVAVPRLRLAQK